MWETATKIGQRFSEVALEFWYFRNSTKLSEKSKFWISRQTTGLWDITNNLIPYCVWNFAGSE